MPIREGGNPELLLMAAGLTYHIWIIEEIVLTEVVPE
jgi:hypothetical protein